MVSCLILLKSLRNVQIKIISLEFRWICLYKNLCLLSGIIPLYFVDLVPFIHCPWNDEFPLIVRTPRSIVNYYFRRGMECVCCVLLVLIEIRIKIYEITFHFPSINWSMLQDFSFRMVRVNWHDDISFIGGENARVEKELAFNLRHIFISMKCSVGDYWLPKSINSHGPPTSAHPFRLLFIKHV